MASAWPARHRAAKATPSGEQEDPSNDLDNGPEQTMNPASRRPVTGIVFRRAQSPSEREAASRLLVDSGVPAATVRSLADAVLFGLWDLAAPDVEALVGVAATRPLDAGAVELCGIAVRAGLRRRGLGQRLLAEVADALRADGAERLVARSPDAHSPAAALLARAGLAATARVHRESARTAVGWLYLEL
jgi:ribosomal protein S18 acetylase RimI-like enzyme